jgi:hypothetical protein
MVLEHDVDAELAYLTDGALIDGADSVAEHDCPLHDDTLYDFDAINAHDQRRLELMCIELDMAERACRRAQLALERDDISRNTRSTHATQLHGASRFANRIRAHMKRIVAGELEPNGPLVDLWDRT